MKLSPEQIKSVLAYWSVTPQYATVMIDEQSVSMDKEAYKSIAAYISKMESAVVALIFKLTELEK